MAALLLGVCVQLPSPVISAQSLPRVGWAGIQTPVNPSQENSCRGRLIALPCPLCYRVTPRKSSQQHNFVDPVQLATLASWVTASVALVALGAGAIYRMARLTQNVEDLRREMYAETRRLDEKNDIQFAHVEQQFRQVDQKFNDMDRKFDQRFTDMDRKFDQRFTDMDRRFNELQTLIRSENAQTRAQIQQLSNALTSHSHDVDGAITFRVPPPAQEE